MNILKWFVTDDGDIRIWNVILAVVILVAVCGPISYYGGVALGWIQKPGEIINANNVQKEYQWFYDKQNALLGFKANIASTQTRIDALTTVNGTDTTKWPTTAKTEYTQLVSIRSQQEIIYNTACAEYQARWDNIFHNLVAPRDIPRECELITGK